MQSLNGIISNTDDRLLARFNWLNQNDRDAVLYLEVDSYSEADIQVNQMVIIKIFDPVKGLCTYSGNIDFLLLHRLHISNFQSISSIDRRNDIKVFTNFETYTIHSFVNEDNDMICRKVRVKLRDLSAGGLCFTSKLDFPLEDEYEFVFDRGKEPIVVKFNILRKIDNPGGGFRYGCRFVGMSGVEEQIIREFVFRKQLETSS